MYLDGILLYQVLDRCEDLFPEWKREGNQFWNSETGYIITKDGLMMHDAVYRGYKFRGHSNGNSETFVNYDESRDITYHGDPDTLIYTGAGNPFFSNGTGGV